ncbi:MAG: hypothetical protein J0I41_12290 [Filimonas sp.]|nr:hypothetical protein [Filimonas sp.]
MNTIFTCIALTFSLLSVIVAYYNCAIQRKHNIKSVKPILHIGQWDYENRLFVTIKNCGTGLAVVNRLYVKHIETQELRNHLYAWLPEKLPANMNYEKYWTPFQAFVVQPGEIIDLVKIPIDDKEPNQVIEREKLRSALCKLEVFLEYEDIYENKMPVKNMVLSHFGRTDNVNKVTVWV